MASPAITGSSGLLSISLEQGSEKIIGKAAQALLYGREIKVVEATFISMDGRKNETYTGTFQLTPKARCCSLRCTLKVVFITATYAAFGVAGYLAAQHYKT